MNKINYINNKDKDGLGKYFLKKAVGFAIIGDFGKAYEFILEGLDILICDCEIGGWLDEYHAIDSDIFNDIMYSTWNPAEYFFVKAYILSYMEEADDLALALDAVDKYLSLKKDEYGYYVKAKIYLKMEEPSKALDNLAFSDLYNRWSYRNRYRYGRIIEEFFSRNGVPYLFEAFSNNVLSICCTRVLQKYCRQHNLNMEGIQPSDNFLLQSFLTSQNDQHFRAELQQYVNGRTSTGVFDREYTSETVDNFVKELMLNRDIFYVDEYPKEENYLKDDSGIGRLIFADEGYPEDESDIENGYVTDYYDQDNSDAERDNFDALTDGQYGDYDDWKDAGGDMDSLRDSMGL